MTLIAFALKDSDKLLAWKNYIVLQSGHVAFPLRKVVVSMK